MIYAIFFYLVVDIHFLFYFTAILKKTIAKRRKKKVAVKQPRGAAPKATAVSIIMFDLFLLYRHFFDIEKIYFFKNKFLTFYFYFFLTLATV